MGVEVRMYGDWKYECLKYNVDHYTHTCMSVWNVHIVVYGLCVCRNGYYCMDVLSLQAKHAVAGNMAWGVDGSSREKPLPGNRIVGGLGLITD